MEEQKRKGYVSKTIELNAIPFRDLLKSEYKEYSKKYENAVIKVFDFKVNPELLKGLCPNCRQKTYFNLFRAEERLEGEDSYYFFWLRCKKCFRLCDKRVTPEKHMSMKDFMLNHNKEDEYK